MEKNVKSMRNLKTITTEKNNTNEKTTTSDDDIPYTKKYYLLSEELWRKIFDFLDNVCEIILFIFSVVLGSDYAEEF
jgi:hypothetical protein